MKNCKKLFALLLAVVMVMGMATTAFAAETNGTIEGITDGITVNGNNVTVDGTSLQWYAADTSIGRYQDGWWAGVKITAPTDYTSGAMYSNNGGTSWKSFDSAKDGDNWMGAWLPITPAYLEYALANNKVLQWTYQFDWDTTDANGSYNAEQTFTITVSPNNITLTKDGATVFQTQNGEVVIKTNDATGHAITIDNAAKGETYQAYKIFDVTYADTDKNKEGLEAFSYTISTTNPWFATVQTYANTDSNGLALTPSAGDDTVFVVTVGDAFSAANFAATLSEAKAGKNPAGAAVATADGSVVIQVSEDGYYFVDTSLGALCSLDTTTPNVTIHEKNTVPSITKKVASDLTDDTYQGYGDGDVFETIKYQLTVNTGSNDYGSGTGVDKDYKIVDTLPAGITADANSVKVSVNGTGWTNADNANYTAEFKDGKLTITLKDTGELKKVKKSTDIIITYTATMNATTVNVDTNGTTTGNQNTVTLTYSNQTSTDTAKVFTYQIGGEYTPDGSDTPEPIIKKVDATDPENPTPLAGVKFILSKTEGEGDAAVTKYATVVDGVLTGWATDKPAEGNIISGEDGGIVVKGLDQGIYILTEVETLDGYNLLDDTITVVITPTYEPLDDNGKVTDSSVKITYQMTKQTTDDDPNTVPEEQIVIENKTGTVLPSTGGMGTTIFYIVGSVLVLGAAILLVVKRRMNTAK